MTKKDLKTGVNELAGALGATVKPMNNGNNKKGNGMKRTKKTATPVTPATTPASETPVPVDNSSSLGTPPAVPAPAATTPAQKPAKLSLKDRILKAASKVDGAAIVGEIKDANDVLGTPETIRAFVDAIITADELIVQNQKFSTNSEAAKEELYKLSYATFRARLAGVAGSAASDINGLLASFEAGKVDVSGQLWKLVTEIVRPAQRIETYRDLSNLLKDLVTKGLVEKKDPRQCPVKAVILGFDRDSVGYVPAMSQGKPVPMADVGWHWIKDAETCLIDGLVDELKKSATGLTAEQAKAGKQGSIFLQIGRGSAAKLEVRRNNGHLEIKILRTVGMDVRPTDWANENVPRANWPNGRLYDAFQAWKNG